MTDLYSEKDLQAISGQLKKRYLLLGCGLAVILAVIVWSMVIRMEWLTVVSVFLFFKLLFLIVNIMYKVEYGSDDVERGESGRRVRKSDSDFFFG